MEVPKHSPLYLLCGDNYYHYNSSDFHCFFTETVFSSYTFNGKFLSSLLSVVTAEYVVFYLVNYYGSENCGSLLSKIVGVRKRSPIPDAKTLIWL